MPTAIAELTGVELTRQKVRDWCEGVLDGSIVSCKWVKLAVKRHLDDLEHGHLRGLYHDPEQVQMWVEFFRCLRHFEGEWAGEPIELDPWQLFVIWNVFGWYRANGTRRFRVVYEEVARKTGKSTFLAGIGLGMLIIDGEPGPQVYSGAVNKQHARKVLHSKAETFAKQSASMRRKLKVKETDGRISCAATNGTYEPLGKDSDVGEGFNPHATLFDELHAHRDREVWDVIDSGEGARSQPIKWAITTAGFDQSSFCFTEIRDQVCQILEGAFEEDDWFGIIFTLDEDDDWQDERCWAKANPQSYFASQIENMRAMARQAARKPAALNNFLTKRLNVWTSQSVKWVNVGLWKKSPDTITEADLRGRTCYSGLDLSANTDLTAAVHLFPVPELAHLFAELPDPVERVAEAKSEAEATGAELSSIITAGECFAIIPRFWIPEARVKDRERSDRAQYEKWIIEGRIKTTPGESIEYSHVVRDIERDLSDFHIHRMGYDPWGPALQIRQILCNEGLDEEVMVRFGQGFASMSPAMKTLERLYFNQRIAGLNHPVMLWMATNVQAKMDAAENVKPDKSAGRHAGAAVTKRIDGFVCLVMAVGVWTTAPAVKSSGYEDHGLFTV